MPAQSAPPRSLLRSAVWTGVGAAVVCATLGIIAVAICWLPVSGPQGNPRSAISAGLLTFLAALHSGVTVDGSYATWVPLGMTALVAFVAWRVGANLGESAEDPEVRDTGTLVRAGLAQAASFTVACLIAVHFAELGTSHVSYPAVAFCSFMLFVLSGGVSFVRASALREQVAARLPAPTVTIARASTAALLVYVVSGALLVIASLLWHHGRVELLQRQVGGGWGSLPILLLSLMAVPNAVVGGASYLAGPGLTVGAGGHVGATATAHGVVPSFPLLGALPTGDGATAAVWTFMALTAVAAGGVLAAVVIRSEDGRAGRLRVRLLFVLVASAAAGIVAAVTAWLSGGGIGSQHLSVIGAPPGWFGLMVTGALVAVSSTTLALAALWASVRHSVNADAPATPVAGVAPRTVEVVGAVRDTSEVEDDASEPGDDGDRVAV